MSSVSLRGVAKSFTVGGSHVRGLSQIDLDVEAGEFLVLLGPSGCGKSTLLRCVAGLETPDCGRVEIGGSTVFDRSTGIDVRPSKRAIAMVFQSYGLWPHMTVAENVEYPLRAQRMKDARRNGRVDKVLEIVKCAKLANRLPAQLSGGQQQRVALARALAPDPVLLLLDEPLSNLDAQLRIDLRRELRELHRRVGFTAIYVTHDQAEAMHLATRVVVMRDGEIEQIGRPHEVYENPSSRYVAEFFGIRNRLELTLEREDVLSDAGPLRGDVGWIKAAASGDANATLFVRGESLRIRPPGSLHPTGALWLDGGVVSDIAYMGATTAVYVAFGSVEFEVVAPRGGAVPQINDAIEVSFAREDGYVYGSTQRGPNGAQPCREPSEPVERTAVEQR